MYSFLVAYVWRDRLGSEQHGNQIVQSSLKQLGSEVEFLAIRQAIASRLSGTACVDDADWITILNVMPLPIRGVA